MIKKVSIKAYETTLVLPMRGPYSNGLRIFNIEGLGSPTATVNGPDGVFRRGIRPQSVSVAPRQIMLTLAVQGSGEVNQIARELIYSYFPPEEPITLTITLDKWALGVPDGETHYSITGYVEQIESNPFARIDNAVVSILCPNPYFSLTTEQSVSHGSGPANVTYAGHASTGFRSKFIFGGPSDTLTITTDRSAQKLVVNLQDIPGGISAGDWIDINTVYGQKSVIFNSLEHMLDGDGTMNMLHYVIYNLGSGWPVLFRGSNTLTFAVTANQAGTSGTVKYYELHGGI